MAFYPSSTPTSGGLYVAVDNFSSTLNGAIDAVQTTITLTSTAGLPTVGILTVDSEKVHYTGVAGNDITGVTRGFSSTSAAPHTDGATISFNIVEEHHNVHSDEIIAVATDLRNAISADLDDGVSPAATAANLKIRLDHIVTKLKEINTNVDWKDAVTKRLVDLVALDGTRSMTGNLPMGGFKLTGLAAGTTNGDSLRYEQVIGLYLLLTGGTMSGDIAMGGNKVTGLGAATVNGDAVRYEQVINQYLLLTGGTLSGDLDTGGNDLRGVATLNDGPIGGFRNRVINGNMQFDQRNEGTAGYTINASSIRTIDMWIAEAPPADGVFTAALNNSNVVDGFTNDQKITVTTADASVGASQDYDIRHVIEGLNVIDFFLGKAAAKTFTLSFWVKASIAGTYGVGFGNSAFNRSYIGQYTINSANTWEYKTITVPGDTAGTWLVSTGVGLRLTFDLGAGTDKEGTAGTWLAANKTRVAGNVRLINTLSATWEITGVQVELGSTATPFERLDTSTALWRVQRYIAKTPPQGTAAIAGAGNPGAITYAVRAAGAVTQSESWTFPRTMRATPTITYFSPAVGGGNNWRNVTDGVSSGNATTLNSSISDRGVTVACAQVAGDGVGDIMAMHALVTAEI